MNNALEITGLTKRYPGFTLDHLSFSLPEGCIMGLIGENGAGKTTALKLMLGLVHPDEGGARLLGRAAVDRETKEHLGVVMDECGFPENLTLHDVDAILSRCYRTWDTLRFQGWADRFELPRKKPVKAFSRGMRMKLSRRRSRTTAGCSCWTRPRADWTLSCVTRCWTCCVISSRTSAGRCCCPRTSSAIWRRYAIT